MFYLLICLWLWALGGAIAILFRAPRVHPEGPPLWRRVLLTPGARLLFTCEWLARTILAMLDKETP